VQIGSLTGRNITRAGTVVKALFDIPINEPIGRKNVVVTFSAATAQTVFSKAGGFEVQRRGLALPAIVH
jgi:hypothetical protein